MWHYPLNGALLGEVVGILKLFESSSIVKTDDLRILGSDHYQIIANDATVEGSRAPTPLMLTGKAERF